MKRVWLIKSGEPLPTDGDDVRLYRIGILAETLAERGYEVVWWSSTVDHAAKRQRYAEHTAKTIRGRLKIYYLRSMLYKRNVSVNRLISHAQMAKAFQRLAVKEPQPDVIVCCLPTPDFCYEAVKYGQSHGVPVIIDIRDLWPDIFLRLFPKVLQPFAKLALQPMYRMVERACRGATGITGITEDFVDWGVAYAGRNRGDYDRCFPLGYKKEAPNHEKVQVSFEKWADFGIRKDDNQFIICFFGSFGRQLQLEPVIQVARMLEANGHSELRFVFCGDGERLQTYRKDTEGLNNVLFPGWVSASDIWALMRLSGAGIIPYFNTEDFMMSIPNKAIEYLSAGLPILTGLDGQLKRLVTEHDCGMYYQGDAETLYSQLLSLYFEKEKLHRLSGNAESLFHARFSADRVYGEMVDFLGQVSKH